MDRSAYDAAAGKVESALAELAESAGYLDPGSRVASWVVVAESAALEDGARASYTTLHPSGQPQHATLGLLRAGLEIELDEFRDGIEA